MNPIVNVTSELKECIHFQGLTPGLGPNPRLEQGVTFTLLGTSGNPEPQTRVSETLGFTGFDCSPTTKIQLPVPALSVELTLVHHEPSPVPVVQAFSGSTLIAAVPMTVGSLQAQTLTIAGPAIDRLLIQGPDNRVKLLQFCFEPVS